MEDKNKKKIDNKKNDEIVVNFKLDKKKLLYILGGIGVVLIIVVGVLLGVNGGDKVKIVKSEVQEITLEDYSTEVFSMKIPKGWTVQSGGQGIYYAIRVTDPKDENNQVFLMLKIQPILKSQSAKKAWQDYAILAGGAQYNLFSKAPVLESATTEGFFQVFGDVSSFINNIEPSLASFKFPTFNNFTKLEESESQASLKSVAMDSKVLRATFTGSKGEAGEGMFLATVVNFGNSCQMGVDMGYYMIYDITAITSKKDEFINYQDILMKCVNSIEFTDSYVKKTIDDSNAQTQQSLQINAQVQAAFDSYMSAWNNRSKTYDIMSQKQSDATLGYERVYDTDTGEIYKAYNGFTDDYSGNRYKSVTDDMYTKSTSGYIEKIGG